MDTQQTQTQTTTPPNPPPEETTEELVPKPVFDRIKDDLFKTKERNRQLEEAVRAKETDQLKDQQKWKELAEVNESRAKEYEEKYNKLSHTVVEERKMAEIRKEAVKLGILPSEIDDLDNQNWSDVTIEYTSTGRINVIGAAKAVERFKTLRPQRFQGPQAPGVNTTTPTVVPGQSAGPVSIKDVQAAEAEAKKSGDYTKYRELLVKFQQQRK